MTRPRDPTQFTRESAERIGRVVRAAELAAPAARPLNFERVDFSRSRVFRVATYTGAWSIGSLKTVTFKYQTATPNTASVTNLFFPVTSTAAGSRDCAIAKDGTAWFLVDIPFVEVDVLVNATLTTAGLQFSRARVAVASSASLSITTIATTAC